MIVFGIYIISNTGTTLVSETFQKRISLPDAVLLGGLFTALYQVAQEMTKGTFHIQSIATEGMMYYVHSYGLFKMVMVTNVSKAPKKKTPREIMHSLGQKFIRQYSDELVDNQGKVSTFIPFKKTIKQVLLDLDLIDVDIKIDPTIRLTPITIINLPNDLQTTALAFIELIEGTITAIAKLTATTEAITASNINLLQQKGLVGKKEKEDQSIYFILT